MVITARVHKTKKGTLPKHMRRKHITPKHMGLKCMNLRCMNKKGMTYETLLMLLFNSMVVIMIAISMVIMVNTSIVRKVNTVGLEAELMIQEIMDVPGLLSEYNPETKRMYKGKVIAKSFAQNEEMEINLNERFEYGTFNIAAAQLKIMDLNLQPIEFRGEPLSPVYYHKEWYDRWAVLSESRLKGVGGVDKYMRRKLVTIIGDDGKETNGVVEITLTLPRS